MQVNGLVIISDMEGSTARHLTLFSLPTMKKLITMMEVETAPRRMMLVPTVPPQTAWPMKPKAEHILNLPGVFESFFSVVQVETRPLDALTAGRHIYTLDN